MSHITLDTAVAEQLKRADKVVELRDPTGRVIGHFWPEIIHSEWEIDGPQLTEEEVERRTQADEWYTFDQAMEHMKAPEKQ